MSLVEEVEHHSISEKHRLAASSIPSLHTQTHTHTHTHTMSHTHTHTYTIRALLDKLEHHSMHEKHRRLSAAVEHLGKKQFTRNQYEAEEALAAKMLFLYECKSPHVYV
jgi:hypothetical protein